jgi:hypothetical protein
MSPSAGKDPTRSRHVGSGLRRLGEARIATTYSCCTTSCNAGLGPFREPFCALNLNLLNHLIIFELEIPIPFITSLVVFNSSHDIDTYSPRGFLLVSSPKRNGAKIARCQSPGFASSSVGTTGISRRLMDRHEASRLNLQYLVLQPTEESDLRGY